MTSQSTLVLTNIQVCLHTPQTPLAGKWTTWLVLTNGIAILIEVIKYLVLLLPSLFRPHDLKHLAWVVKPHTVIPESLWALRGELSWEPPNSQWPWHKWEIHSYIFPILLSYDYWHMNMIVLNQWNLWDTSYSNYWQIQKRIWKH